MLCRDCHSSEFRISRFRWHDIFLLALFRYPIRCKRCKTRTHTALHRALKLSRKRHPKAPGKTISKLQGSK